MKNEVAIKFRLPKEQFEYDIYCQAEDMHTALVALNRFLFSGNRDLTLDDIQGFFADHTAGIKL